MKKFISGFLVGAMLFGAIGAFAVSYVANPLDYKVIVNGEEFVSDPPALEVEGRTYLPLRAMGDALGVPVNWNEELRQAEVGAISSDTTVRGYKTYAESKVVIDFGEFCKINTVARQEFDGYVEYYYNSDEVDADTSVDYLKEMQKKGYTVKEEKKDGLGVYFFGINYDDLDQNPFSWETGLNPNDFKYYIRVTIFK